MELDEVKKLNIFERVALIIWAVSYRKPPVVQLCLTC